MKLFLLIISYFVCVTNAAQITNTSTITTSFTSCLASANVHNFSIATSSSYNHLLNFSVRNLRFVDQATTRRPVALVLPGTKRQLRSAVVCCRDLFLSIRLRSGGHSYEGLSYTAAGTNPFVVVDLMNLNRVRVNLTDSTAWVESGATLGEIYYAVANVSGGSLAFPAGSCSTVGSGGHIAGGGFGFLGRKYGLAADNVLDAVLIDSAGRVLDRSSMGEDVFWAVRGGGGGSWGAIYAWKVRLVPVPDRVTTCRPGRSMPSRLAAELVHKWQHVSPALPDEFYLSVAISATVNVTNLEFSVQFLGPLSDAVSVLARRFPELGLNESDCTETSWVESAVRFAGLKSKSDLTDRTPPGGKTYFKSKSDYVRVPIPSAGLIGVFNWLAQEPKSYIILDPYGGAMGRIPSHDVPFPHRRGNLYGIQYSVSWTEEDDGAGYKHVAWLREFYEYMARYVSKNPRAAYVNYVDLDLGVVNWSGPYRDRAGSARVWGEKYFLENYDRLVRAKTAIDPRNVFSHQQSIPPLLSS